MSFLDRAKSMHERGDTARAAVVLAEGLKREPGEVEALEWLLHLYVEEIENTGIEREILRILELQTNGLELYALVVAELEAFGADDKLDALERVRSRDGLLPEPEPEPDPAEAAVQRATGEEEPMPDAGGKDSDPQAGEAPGDLERATGPVGTGLPGRATGGAGGAWDAFENPLAQTERSSGPTTPLRSPTDPLPARGSDGERPAAQHATASDQRLRNLVLAGVAVFLFAAAVILLSGRGEPDPAPAFVPDTESLDQEPVLRHPPGGESGDERPRNP
ncbi:MAG: hypothetical protein EA398_06380 [Deltaproteobacteria bacterium]|nr:MAG: hypothetical protein EA398_06380 [Deltaproteobacteria bacterium]